MTVFESNYTNYLYGGLLHGRYLRVKGLNEGSFGIVSIAKDTKDNDKLVAVKYNTGKLSDFEAYQKSQTENNNLINEVRSVSLNSKTRSVIRSDGNYSNTTNANDKDVSKSIVLRETNQEILMLKKVDSHPNIITLLDHFDTFMIFEYAPRGDLHDAIQLGISPVATCDVIDVFMQLISAVEFCHKNGVYHRDIKPENILISEDWSIKLTDFGLATDHLICDDFDVGSERYMAPELLEHSDIDSYAADKVDIWSLGVCLLNIVFGKSPFRSASSKDKMFLHFAANRETLFDIFPFMSYDLFSVMIHSLTIDPANRDLEMIKQNLLNIDVLTYDYEFEEDDIEINNKENILVEDLNEDIDKHKEITHENDQPNDNKIDNMIIHNDITEITLSNDIINRSKNSDNENIITKSNNFTTDKENELPKLSPKKIESPKLPTIITTSNDEMESIDTTLEKGEKIINNNKDNDSKYAISKPITIQKKYEPPHKFLNNNLVENKKVYSNSRKSNHYNSYNNSNYNNHNNYNNNNNHRAKRWIPAHRKPLKIANYNYRNRSQDGRVRGRESFKEDSFDFNRKDFFTPRSVFTSYMEKANKGKQQLQQRSSYYKKNKDHDNGFSYNNSNYRYNSNNNGNNNYYNYADRRAWKKRKRRSSYAQGNNNNTNKNKGSYRVNLKSKNSRLEGLNWSLNNSGNEYKIQNSRRLSSTGANYSNNNNTNNNTHLTHISSSLRSSMDGKYIPPNLRLNASHLIGSAIVSDDETDLDNDNYHKKYDNKFRHKKGVDNIEEEEDSSNNDDSEEDTFSFEFDQPTLSELKHTDILNPASPINDGKFHQIQSNAINLLSKQFGESKLFDDKGSSRNTSLTTTVSNNFSSTGSNINSNSPKGYKKYIPPHHRRSSHSAAETIEIKSTKPLSNNINHFSKNDKNDDISPVSTSAPTKSSSFFNSFNKTVAPHELLTEKGYKDFMNGNQNDDLFNIEEGKNYKYIR